MGYRIVRKMKSGVGEMVSFSIICVLLSVIFIYITAFLQYAHAMDALTNALTAAGRAAALCESEEDARRRVQMVAEAAVTDPALSEIETEMSYADGNSWEGGSYVKVTVRAYVRTMDPYILSGVRSKSLVTVIEEKIQLYGSNINLSPEAEALRPLVEACAAEYGISEYVPVLMAIIMNESGGVYHPDGGEYTGISDASGGIAIGAEESLREEARIFRDILDYTYARGCDLDTAIQSYNYGPGFADFVAARGGAYSFELAEEFAMMYSGGATVPYVNAISVPINGGWRYQYGCMFYVLCAHQYLG